MSATRLLYAPIPNPLCAFSTFTFCVFIDPVQVPGPSYIVSSLSYAFSAAKRALRSVRRSASATVESVKQVHHFLMWQAESKLEENRGSCLEFLRESVIRYGEKMVMICTSFTAYSPFQRTRASQDLRDEAASLRNERIEIIAHTPIRTRGTFLDEFVVTLADAHPLGMRKFNCMHAKTLSLLQKMDHKLNALLACIPTGTCVNQMDTYSTLPVSNIKRHKRRLETHKCIWLKIRDALEQELMVLPPVDDFLTVGSV